MAYDESDSERRCCERAEPKSPSERIPGVRRPNDQDDREEHDAAADGRHERPDSFPQHATTVPEAQLATSAIGGPTMSGPRSLAGAGLAGRS